jgi:hypothetical protein
MIAEARQAELRDSPFGTGGAATQNVKTLSSSIKHDNAAAVDHYSP